MVKKIIILIGLGFFLIPLVVTAQTKITIPTDSLRSLSIPKTTITPSAAPVKTPVVSDKPATTAAVKGVLARCAIVESKIQVKATDFDNSKVKHLDVYNKVKLRLVDITEKLATQGLDVTALKADLVIYDQKIKKFSDDYASYIGILKDSQTYVCGKSEVQFRARFKEAKTALTQVHQDAVAVQTYYAQALKPEVNRLRAILGGEIATSTTVTSTVTNATVTSTTATNTATATESLNNN